MYPLDNVIWHALSTRQAGFAESLGEVRRFSPEIGPLGGFPEPTEKSYASLADLLGSGGTVALFLDRPFESRPGWTLLDGSPLLQMAWSNGRRLQVSPASGQPAFSELHEADAPEMLELAALTKPGPFMLRTRELGTFIGIRQSGRIVAMSGERLKVPGHTEVSAVCTHPDHLGKGYASMLMSEIMRRICERSETPFLHVRQENTRAIELYERLGFRQRRIFHLAVLRKD